VYCAVLEVSSWGIIPCMRSAIVYFLVNGVFSLLFAWSPGIRYDRWGIPIISCVDGAAPLSPLIPKTYCPVIPLSLFSPPMIPSSGKNSIQEIHRITLENMIS